MLIIEEQLTQLLKSLDLLKNEEITLEFPANNNFGDLACNIALQLFGKLSSQDIQNLKLKSSHDLATYLLPLIQKLVKNHPELKQVITVIQVAGPGFINFTFADQYLLKLPQAIISDSTYGQSQLLHNKTWEIEHTSPNPNKSMHLGHLRNNITAMAIANLWEVLGAKVTRDAVDNNRGIAIARLMWGYLKFAHKNDKQITDLNYWFDHQDEWLSPEDKGLRPDKFVDDLYFQASQDFKKNKEVEAKVRQMVVAWESEDPKNRALWSKVLEFSYLGQQMTLQRLNNQWDVIWHEHEHYQLGKELVELGLKKGIFNKLEDGAVLTNLKKYNLPDTIVQKSDGTSLYLTQDIALTKLKKEKLKADKLHWVVGPDQSLALKQLFAICDQLEIANYQDLTHIAYGYMSIKGQGKMSSRLGNVVYIDDLIDAVKDEVKQVMKSGNPAQVNIENIAENVALGAIKYSIVKIGRMSDVEFDLEQALKLDGNSGPYLQYAHTRAKSVLSKAKQKASQISLDDYAQYSFNDLEKELLRHLIKYPKIIQQAGLTYEPSVVATFLYELAQKFNSFYNKHHILTAQSSKKKFRIVLTAASAQVLKHGLCLLGINIPEYM